MATPKFAETKPLTITHILILYTTPRLRDLLIPNDQTPLNQRDHSPGQATFDGTSSNKQKHHLDLSNMCWRAVGKYTCGRHPIMTYAYCASAPDAGTSAVGDSGERQPCENVTDVPQKTLIPCVKPGCMALSAGFQPARLTKDPKVTDKVGGDRTPKSPLTGEDAAATGGDASSATTGDGNFSALWIEGADGDLHHVCRCYADGCGCTKFDNDMGNIASLRCEDCREMKGECLVKNAALDSVLAKTKTSI